MSGSARWRWLVAGVVVVALGSLISCTTGQTTLVPATVPPGDGTDSGPGGGGDRPGDDQSSACGPIERTWTDRQVAVVLGAEGTPTVTGYESAPRMQTPVPPEPIVFGKNDPTKLHPVIRGWIASEVAGTQVVDVVVGLSDPFDAPPLPEFDEEAVTESIDKVKACITFIVQSRSPFYGDFISDYSLSNDSSRPLWMVSALSTSTTLANVQAMAQDPRVIYIEPNDTGYGPSSIRPGTDASGEPERHAISPVDAETKIRLTPFKGSAATTILAVLDSGSVAGTVTGAYDCIDGNILCEGGFQTDEWMHGVRTIKLLSDMDIAVNTIRSIRIYGGVGGKGKSAKVVDIAQGFQAALAFGSNEVILAQAQPEEHSVVGLTARSADHAFDRGRVVIAPAGNFGRHTGNLGVSPYAWLVAAPGSAHKALAVGAYVDEWARLDAQRIGYTADGRVKPDLHFPTDIDPAIAGAGPLGGTSGAASVAAAAAVHVRNWMNQMGRLLPGGTSDYEAHPGEVYAFLINHGDQFFRSSDTEQGFSPFSGGGKLVLSAVGHSAWGKLQITPGVPASVKLPPQTVGKGRFDATIWWPDDAGGTHQDFDLVVKVNGTAVADSVACLSVFEHARAFVDGSVTGANMVLELEIDSNQASPRERDVFWATHLEALDPATPLPVPQPLNQKSLCSTPSSPIQDPGGTQDSDPPELGQPRPRPASSGPVRINGDCAASPSGSFGVIMREMTGSGASATCNGDPLGATEVASASGSYNYSFEATPSLTPTPGIPPLNSTATPTPPDYCIAVVPLGATSPEKTTGKIPLSSGTCVQAP